MDKQTTNIEHSEKGTTVTETNTTEQHGAGVNVETTEQKSTTLETDNEEGLDGKAAEGAE